MESNSGHSAASIAAFLVTRGLAVPAIFILEMQKPLCGLLHAAGDAALPMLGALLGPARSRDLVELFGSPGRVELLITEIEAAEQRRRGVRA